MKTSSLREAIFSNLDQFPEDDSQSASKVKEALEVLPEELDNEKIIEWWEKQNDHYALALINFLFWMWTTKRIEYNVFELAYETLNPLVSQSWQMPIEISSGLDLPLLEGGFLNREFSIFQYKFSPANHGFQVNCEVFPEPVKKTDDFDAILDFMSFLIGKYNYGYLGFRSIPSRKWSYSSRTTIGSGTGPEVRQDMIDFDFQQIEEIIRHLSNVMPLIVRGLSLPELLRVRHRAILDSSLESKLITLWSAIESQWGQEEKNNELLSEEEIGLLQKAITFLGKEKSDTVIKHVKKLNVKTKNDRIIAEVEKIKSVAGWEVNKTIKDIFSLRSKFAHGGLLREKEVEKVKKYISFMLQIIDELINDQMSEIGVRFSQPK